jgi:hypothetical protein
MDVVANDSEVTVRLNAGNKRASHFEWLYFACQLIYGMERGTIDWNM